MNDALSINLIRSYDMDRPPVRGVNIIVKPWCSDGWQRYRAESPELCDKEGPFGFGETKQAAIDDLERSLTNYYGAETMKKFGKISSILFLSLFLCVSAFADKVRIGDNLPFQTTAVISGVTVIVPVTNIVSIQICAYPANAVPCTNKVTTYSDVNGSSCPSSTQVVLAGTTTCVAAADSLGNWGAWTDSQSIAVTAQRADGSSIGPIAVTAMAAPPGTRLDQILNPSATTTFSMGSNPIFFQFSTGSDFREAAFMGPTANGNPGFHFWRINDLSGSIALVFDPTVGNAQAPIAVRTQGDGTTSQFKLVKVKATQSTLTATAPTTSDTSGTVFGICVANCSGTSSLSIAVAGVAACVFDSTITSGQVGDWVVVSSTIAGDCHDTGSATTYPVSGTVIGRAYNNATINANPNAFPVLLQISR